MQSKLPVRIKRKQLHADKKKCCCAQLLKIIIDNPIDSDKFCTKKENSTNDNKRPRTKSTQTEKDEIRLESEKKPYIEMKNLLISINCTLENILHSLQDKKEYLYGKLQDESLEPSKKPKAYCSKNKIEKIKKKNLPPSRKSTYAWPEISRLYYGQPSWLKHYMQKFEYGLPSADSNFLLSTRQRGCVYASRPFSCSDINYFQPIRSILQCRPYDMTVYRNPMFTLLGQGDLNLMSDNDIDDCDNPKSIKEASVPDIDKEVQ